MADLPRRDELFQRFRAGVLATPNTRISARAIDTDGTDANLIAASSSLLGDEIVSRMARALAGCFESSARGDALDRLIMDRKGLPRKPAAPSVGFVQLTRPTAAAGAGVIVGAPPGSMATPTVIRTNTGTDYILTENAIFGAADLGPITVGVQAVLAGLASQVEGGQAWTFGSAVFDPTIVIANAEAMAGGADIELDAPYKSRSRLFFQALRRGTLAAIEAGALAVPGVSSVTAYEALNLDGKPACLVEVFILDSVGRANARLAARVQRELLTYRAAGIPTIVTAGSVDFVPIRIQNASFDARIVQDTSLASDDVRSAIVASLGNQRPGENLLRGSIIAAARTIPGFLLDDSDLVEPIATLEPGAPGIAIRTRRELISIS